MFKLTAQIIGDDIIGVDLPVPPQGFNPNDPNYSPFRIEETPSTAYAEISSIENWYRYGIQTNKYLNRDYIFIRDRIEDLIKQKGVDSCIATQNDPPATPVLGDRYCIGNNPSGDWANYPNAIAIKGSVNWEFKAQVEIGYEELTQEEKAIAAELYIGELRVYGLDFPQELAEWRGIYHRTSTATRERRLWKAETIVRHELSAYQSAIMLFLTSKVDPIILPGMPEMNFCVDHHKNYWRFGIRGTVEEYDSVLNPFPSPGIMDYIYGRGDFAPIGLINMPWQPANMASMQEVADAIASALVTDGV